VKYEYRNSLGCIEGLSSGELRSDSCHHSCSVTKSVWSELSQCSRRSSTL